MVDARILYQDLDPELKGYGEMWDFLKKELSSPDSESKTCYCSCENTQMNSYELDPELKDDIESVKGAAEGFGPSGEYGKSSS